jgi:hypothetical protein
LTTASDERSGKPAHSRRLAPHPLRPVFSNPAPSRGPVGSITPQSKVRRPYAKALRVVETRKAPTALGPDARKSARGLQAGPRRAKAVSGGPQAPLRLPGGAARSVRLGPASSQAVSARGWPSNTARSRAAHQRGGHRGGIGEREIPGGCRLTTDLNGGEGTDSLIIGLIG